VAGNFCDQPDNQDFESVEDGKGFRQGTKGDIQK
jgi:hypothetical protein